MIKYKIYIDSVDYSYALPLPFKEKRLLDEALDYSVITLQMISTDEFRRFALVQINQNDGTTEVDRYFLLASDNVTEVIATNLYNHEITLIEETKLLEKKIVDTNTFTNPLTHDYLAGASNVVYTATGDLDVIKNYISPRENGSFLRYYYVGSIFDIPGGLPVNYTATTTITKDGEEIYSQNDSGTFPATGDRGYFVTETGNYIITYTLSITLGFNIYNGSVTYSIYSLDQETAPDDYTITDVINRLLAITKTERMGATPQFTLNSEQATEFADIKAPEFAFTKKTLKECLDDVGGYIHAIPRLRDSVIYFDKLGSNETQSLDLDYITNQKTYDIEQFCSSIDTNVDNLVNLNENNEGTIIEPFANAYETVRTETTGVRITDDSALIETEYPIEKILKVEVGYLSDGTLVGDITPYIYESAEYQELSGVIGEYPYSKAYALYYTQGSKNIQGLNFKLPNPINPIFSQSAVINIIERKTNNPNIHTIFNVQEFVGLAFRITYTPLVSARVKQSKTDLMEFEEEITSVYNQTANKVDSTFYGENLKGAVARLGNIEKVQTFIIPKLADIPTIGTLVDDIYYISAISLEYLTNYIKCTIALSKDFNRLNKYVGIKNNLRMYEVSEKQAVERYVIYEDYCVIGDSYSTSDRGLLTDSAIALFINDFNGVAEKTPVSVVRANGIDSSENPLQEFDLPVVSLGMGNTIWFGYKYADNYSAGNTSSTGTEAGGSDYYRVQNYSAYGNYFGRIENLTLNMYASFGEVITDYSEQQAIGNALPISTIEISTNALISTAETPIILKKDSRENVNFSYQCHFVTNRTNFIIGSGLALNCGLVLGGQDYVKLYILPTKLNKFETIVDISAGTLIKNYQNNITDITQSDNVITFANETATTDGLSWALVLNSTNELIFGQNIMILKDDTIQMPKMTFTHTIF